LGSALAGAGTERGPYLSRAAEGAIFSGTCSRLAALDSLRAVAENGDWATYQRFHQQQRYQRLYGVPLPTQDALEEQALSQPQALAQTPPGRAFIMPVIVKQPAALPHKHAA